MILFELDFMLNLYYNDLYLINIGGKNMDIIQVKFLGKDYSFPSDVITYIGLADFTNEISSSLAASFKNHIEFDISSIEANDLMMKEFTQKASSFVKLLLDNGIYHRTAPDYLQNNNGFKLFSEAKKIAANEIFKNQKEKYETYKSGVEDAMIRKDASVTGLDFSVISSSFVNHMVYAYMDASKQHKQEKEALKVYNQEIAALDKLAASYDKKESDYIYNNLIPTMNNVFNIFAYGLLDTYISDLIEAGKFDKEALGYINLERSNDLLDNLELSNNKEAVLESAFIACPFNIAVYMEAMNHDLLDYNSFMAAKTFEQGEKIISFLNKSLGSVCYPEFCSIDIKTADLLACYTNRDAKEIVFNLTKDYANRVVREYQILAQMINHKERCREALLRSGEDSLLIGSRKSEVLVQSLIQDIVSRLAWNNLVKYYGHDDLLARVSEVLPYNTVFETKEECDKRLQEDLFLSLEAVRVPIAENLSETRRKKQLEDEKAKEEEQKANKRNLFFICSAILVVVVFIIVSNIVQTTQRESYIQTQVAPLLAEFEERIENKINEDIHLDYKLDFDREYTGEYIYKWHIYLLSNKIDNIVNAGEGAKDEDVIALMKNIEDLEDIFDDMRSEFNLSFEYKGSEITLEYEERNLEYKINGTNEIFSYKESYSSVLFYSEDTTFEVKYNY